MNLAGNSSAPGRSGGALIAALLLTALGFAPVAAQEATPADERPSYDLIQDLLVPIQKRASDLRGDGASHRRGVISKNFKRIDDDTYKASFQQDTATADKLTTEHLSLTLRRQGSEKWEIADEQLVDTFVLHRQHGFRVYPFETFKFDKGGIQLSASKGYMVESYLAGEVVEIIVVSDKLDYTYTAPAYRNFDQLYKVALKDHRAELVFDPQLFEITCDPQTCEEIIAGSFTGMNRPAPADAGPLLTSPEDAPDFVDAGLKSRYADEHKDMMDERQAHPFSQFGRGTLPGNRWFIAWVEANDKHGLGLAYDNWAGYEYRFVVLHDAPGSVFFQSLAGLLDEESQTDSAAAGGDSRHREGFRRYEIVNHYLPLFGYYSDETLAANTTRELEARYDKGERWYDVSKIEGTVELGLDDPDSVRGDITFGLNLRSDAKELPFFLLTRRRGQDGDFSNQTLFVNSVEYQGQDLTCVRTGPFSYLVVLPEELPAGSTIELKVDFASRVILRVNHAFSVMAREGWLPFVRPGDQIDQFDLTVLSPGNFEVVATGEKVSEEKRGSALATRWVAKSAVEFPYVAFGRYQKDRPKETASHSDGSEIQVEVYVDDASIQSEGDGIRTKQLRPVGMAALGALQLYEQRTGVDYPYSKLALLNNPTVLLEGQASSSVVNLSPLVFRGESFAAELVAAIRARESGLPRLVGDGGESTSRYYRSLVPHGVGHQWFGSHIAAANSRSYWFVEALPAYLAADWLAAAGDTQDYLNQVDDWRKYILETDQRTAVQDGVTLWAGGGEFPGEATLATLYGKGPFVFHILRQTFGEEKFFAGFRELCKELAGKGEIVTEDIRLAAEKAFAVEGPGGQRQNVDLTWFFDQWVRSAGIPQFAFSYEARQTEDGNWMIEGTVKQRVVVGNKSNFHVLDDTYFRALAQITVTGSDKQEYPVRFPIGGPETPFRFKVPVEPREIVFNKYNKILAHDVLVNRDF